MKRSFVLGLLVAVIIVISIVLPVARADLGDVVPLGYVAHRWFGDIELTSYVIKAADRSAFLYGYFTPTFSFSVTALYVNVYSSDGLWIGRVDLTSACSATGVDLTGPFDFKAGIRMPFTALASPNTVDRIMGLHSTQLRIVGHLKLGWFWFAAAETVSMP